MALINFIKQLIDAAVFYLKAVNPNIVIKVDTRMPQQIIDNVNAQSRIINDLLSKLESLLK